MDVCQWYNEWDKYECFSTGHGNQKAGSYCSFFRYGDYLKTKQNGYIKNNVMEKQADITGFSDYSSITDYALEAVSWAVATKLITGEVGDLIEPQKIVVRETAAELMKRFGIYVEGINFSRDIYGFTNGDFEHDNYYITNQHKSILYNYLEATGEIDDDYDGVGMTVQDEIEANIADDYGGSCFGVALSTILNKVGKLDYTRHFGGTSAEFLRDIDTLENNSSLESAINYYQFSVYASGVRNDRISTRRWRQNSLLAWRSWIENLPNVIDRFGCILFSYGYTSGTSTSIEAWHSVIIYDYEINVNSYTFYIYDPNYLTKREMSASYVVESGKKTLKLEYGSQIIVVGDYLYDFFNIEHRYNRYDIDSYYNDFVERTLNIIDLIDQEYIFNLYNDDETMSTNGYFVNELAPYTDTIPR